MNPTCEDFDRLAAAQPTADTEERELWQRHLEGCLRCRQQMAADQVLRTALAPEPGLSFSQCFDASLRRRLYQRRPPRSLGLVARSFLAGYGTAAAGLSIWILAEIDWPSFLSQGAAGALLVLAALATPLLLLPRSSPLALPWLD